MKYKLVALAALLASSSAFAGDFVNLRDDLSTLTPSNGGLQTGANAPTGDKFYLQGTSYNWLSGYEYDGEFVNSGNLVASSISYTANITTRPFTQTAAGTLTLLDWRVTTNVTLLPGVAQASVYDFVYRDSRDDKLVFGTRYVNEVANGQEVNYLYRYGFEGFETSAAWLFLSDYDLRLYQAGRTEDFTYNNSVTFDADAVRQKSDISVSEGNPYSGLFLVKTDATDYILGDRAIGYFQAGEEGQSVVGGYIGGFIPTVAAVPEPSEYALMLLGLGMVGFVATRRKKQNLA